MNIKKSIYSILGVLAVLFSFTACSPDGYDLGDKDVTSADLVEGKAFSITHDSSNPNIVYLKSLMSSRYTVLWEHPQGRTQDSEVTLKIPFAGTYTVKFGVETRGGVVYGDPVTFTVDDFCADFVTGQAWTYLAGGVGQSKTWVYDNGEYGLSSGELSYGDPDANADMGLDKFTANWDPGKGHCGDDAMWESTMTFSLQGKAGYEFYNSTDGTTQSGLFSVNEDDYTIGFTDADMMHPTTWDARRDSWRSGQIIELDENHLRIAYVRIPGDWGGKWVEVFNYVSKDYADNYTPAEDPNPAPSLADTWQTDITKYNKEGNTYSNINWKIAETTDATAYADLYGSITGGQASATDNGLEYSLLMNSYDMSYTSKDADGNEVSGTFSISDDGFIHFSNGLQKAAISADGTIQTNKDNTLRVLAYTMDATDPTEITDLYLGYDMYDAQGKRYQYKAFHFTPHIVGQTEVETFKASMHYFNTGWTFFDSPTVKITGEGTYTFTITGTDSDPYGIYLDINKILTKYPNMDMVITDMRVDGKSIAFDDALIDRGNGDGSDVARRYILNPWNNDNYFMANGYSCLAFSSSLEVDLKVTYNTGTPFIASEAKTAAKQKAVAKAKATAKAKAVAKKRAQAKLIRK